MNDNFSVSRNPFIKVLLICGILSSILYAAMNVFVAMQYEGYNSVSQTVSELSAINAPTRTLWVSLGTVYTLLVIAFGWGIIQSANQKRSLYISGSLIIVYGIISLGWPFAPMHQREVLASGGSTFSDTMHIAFTIVTVLIMLFAMGFGAVSFRKPFRIYSIVSIFLLLFFGILTGIEAPAVNANLPTPFIGVWERINIGVFLFMDSNSFFCFISNQFPCEEMMRLALAYIKGRQKNQGLPD